MSDDDAEECDDDDVDSANVAVEEKVPEMRFDRNGHSLSFYVALLFAHDESIKDTAKVPTLIVVTRTPLDDVVDQNQGTIRHRFAGKGNGALCKLQQIIGPVDTYARALEIQTQWKNNSRGLVGRGIEGRALADRHNLPCWDAHADRQYEKPKKRTTRKRKPASNN